MDVFDRTKCLGRTKHVYQNQKIKEVAGDADNHDSIGYYYYSITIEVGGCRNAKEEISIIHAVTYQIWQHQHKLVEPTEKLPMAKD